MWLLDGTDHAIGPNRKLSVAARSRSAAGYFRGEDASGRNAYPFGSGLPGANLCTHFALNLLVNDNRRIDMESVQALERNETYDVGDFGDVRLKKTERPCYRAWCRSRRSVFGNWQEAGRERCSMVAGWRMTK